MSKEEMMQVHIKGKSRYLPWPELYHSARSLFAVAREYKPGSAHVVTAAVVLSAFAVEGFCQTLGPQVLRETWDAPKQPSTGQGSEVGSKKAKKFGDERLPVCDKLKKIGKACGVSVDYGTLRGNPSRSSLLRATHWLMQSLSCIRYLRSFPSLLVVIRGFTCTTHCEGSTSRCTTWTSWRTR